MTLWNGSKNQKEEKSKFTCAYVLLLGSDFGERQAQLQLSSSSGTSMHRCEGSWVEGLTMATANTDKSQGRMEQLRVSYLTLCFRISDSKAGRLDCRHQHM